MSDSSPADGITAAWGAAVPPPSGASSAVGSAAELGERDGERERERERERGKGKNTMFTHNRVPWPSLAYG